MLTSKQNVNEDMLNKIYNEKITTLKVFNNISYKQFDKLNTLKLFDNDLEKIYEMHRAMGSEIQKSKILKPYKELLYELLKEQKDEQISILKKVKELVKW